MGFLEAKNCCKNTCGDLFRLAVPLVWTITALCATLAYLIAPLRRNEQPRWGTSALVSLSFFAGVGASNAVYNFHITASYALTSDRYTIQAKKKQVYCHFALSSAFIILSAVLSIFFVDERSHDHDGKPDQLDGAGLWVPLFSVLLGRVKQAQVKGPNDDGLASVDQTPVHRGQRLDHCKPAEVVKCYANPVRANKGFEP